MASALNNQQALTEPHSNSKGFPGKAKQVKEKERKAKTVNRQGG
jgi:hypothetical protein